MTKDQAVAFLSEAGQMTDVYTVDENTSRILFKYEGNRVTLIALEDDSDFLCLQCSYVVEEAVRDEIAIARTVAQLESRFKVIKVCFDLEDNFVLATAEQFLPPCREFARVFWRLVDLTVRVAGEAYRELDTTVVAGIAAERFTDDLEADLHLKSDRG